MEIVEVATDLAGRLIVGGEVPAWKIGYLFGEKGALDELGRA
jgi:hypothetical protein